LLMSTLATNIVSFIRKEGIVTLSTVMRMLVDLVKSNTPVSSTSADCTHASTQSLVSLCLSVIPETFIRSLLEQIASEMVMSLISCYVYFQVMFHVNYIDHVFFNIGLLGVHGEKFTAVGHFYLVFNIIATNNLNLSLLQMARIC